MRPGQVIEKVGPDTLRVVFVAFDEAWAEIATNYGDDQIEGARTRLANMLLSVTTEGVRDPVTLKRLSVVRCFSTVVRFSRTEALARLVFQVRRLFSGSAIVSV